MTQGMPLHALQQGILVLMPEPDEAKSAGGPDFFLAESRLGFWGKLLHQSNALNDPCLSVTEKSCDARHRHAFIVPQGMGNASFVQG